MFNLTFGDIYYPVLTAFITSTIIFEILHFGINYWLTTRQFNDYRTIQDKLRNGEIQLTEEMLEAMPQNMDGMSFNFPPTSSGTNKVGVGQYL